MKHKYADLSTEDEERDNNDDDEGEEGSKAFNLILLKNSSKTSTKK